jgi:hypothetical protein
VCRPDIPHTHFQVLSCQGPHSTVASSRLPRGVSAGAFAVSTPPGVLSTSTKYLTAVVICLCIIGSSTSVVSYQTLTTVLNLMKLSLKPHFSPSQLLYQRVQPRPPSLLEALLLAPLLLFNSTVFFLSPWWLFPISSLALSPSLASPQLSPLIVGSLPTLFQGTFHSQSKSLEQRCLSERF